MSSRMYQNENNKSFLSRSEHLFQDAQQGGEGSFPPKWLNLSENMRDFPPKIKICLPGCTRMLQWCICTHFLHYHVCQIWAFQQRRWTVQDGIMPCCPLWFSWLPSSNSRWKMLSNSRWKMPSNSRWIVQDGIMPCHPQWFSWLPSSNDCWKMLSKSRWTVQDGTMPCYPLWFPGLSSLFLGSVFKLLPDSPSILYPQRSIVFFADLLNNLNHNIRLMSQSWIHRGA